MTRLLIILCSLLATAALAGADRPDNRRIVLLLPNEVTAADISAVVVFRWDGEADVTIPAFEQNRAVIVEGRLRFFAADGRELPMSYPMTAPAVRIRERTVHPGEVLHMRLEYPGWLMPLPPGEYYGIAEFTGITAQRAVVRFVSPKRWFSVRRWTAKSTD